MATTEAQKRAKAKYKAAKVMKFYPGNEDLLAHLEKQPSQNAYILELIRRDRRGVLRILKRQLRSQRSLVLQLGTPPQIPHNRLHSSKDLCIGDYAATHNALGYKLKVVPKPDDRPEPRRRGRRMRAS